MMQGLDGVGFSHPFIGVVESVDDPQKIYRVKVRCYGYHPEDKSLVPTKDLPWATPIFPVTSASSGGLGQGLGLTVGSWVFGFMLDGARAQMPMIMGSLYGKNPPSMPGVGSAPNSAGAAPNPPKFHGTPSGTPGPNTQTPGPSGSLVGPQSPPPGPPPGGYPSTAEIREDTGYLTNKDANNWPGRSYKPQQFASKGNGQIYFHKGTLLALELAMKNFGRALPINSAYRDPGHNGRVGGARGSQHMYGRAVDISISGLGEGDRIRLVVELLKAGFVGFGIGPTIVHADTRRTGTYWGYPKGTPPAKWFYTAIQQAGINPLGRPPFNGGRGVSGDLSGPMPQAETGGGGSGSGDGGGSSGGGGGSAGGGGGGGGGTSGGRSYGNPVGGSAVPFGTAPAASTMGYGSLADQRSRFAGELANPQTRAMFYARTQIEVGSQGPLAQQAFMESVMNRAAARGQSLAYASQDPNYFPRGDAGKVASMAQNSEYLDNKYGPTSQAVMSGSNVSNFATGNASGSVGFGGNPASAAYGGERFGVENRNSDNQWAANARASAASETPTDTGQQNLPADNDPGGRAYDAEDQGFVDPWDQYPDQGYRGDSDVNKSARGNSQEDENPADWDKNKAQRDDNRWNSQETAGGQPWSETGIPYQTQYPHNFYQAIPGTFIEMDGTPGAQRFNIQGPAGSGIHIGPWGQMTEKAMAEAVRIHRSNQMSYTHGMNIQSNNGTVAQLNASDQIVETGGVKEDRELNDKKIQAAGNIMLAAGENIRVNGVNLYFDGQALHIVGDKIQIRSTGSLDIKGKTINLETEGDLNIKSGAVIKTESKGDFHIKSGAALKTESSGDMNLKAGGKIKAKGTSFENASDSTKHNKIEWKEAIGPEPAGMGATPTAPDGADAAEKAKEADESDLGNNLPRHKKPEERFKPSLPGPMPGDHELDTNGNPRAYRNAFNETGSPSGEAVDSDFPQMDGDDNYHEPDCLFTGTFSQMPMTNLPFNRSLMNVQGIENFLKTARRDNVPIPKITQEQLSAIIKVAQKNKFPLEMMIGVLSFKNWQGAEQLVQVAKQGFKAIQGVVGGREPLRGEIYMGMEHGIHGALRLIQKALDPKKMNQYVVDEKDKRNPNAVPRDPDALRKKELFQILDSAGKFKRWRTYREHYDMMHHRLNHGFGRIVIPALFKALL